MKSMKVGGLNRVSAVIGYSLTHRLSTLIGYSVTRTLSALIGYSVTGRLSALIGLPDQAKISLCFRLTGLQAVKAVNFQAANSQSQRSFMANPLRSGPLWIFVG
jgi:hypothetical protein